MRFAACTVFVFVMMVCATIIVVSPHIGLGDYEQFFLYQALGISRRHALPVPLSLIAIAIVYGILSSGIKRQPNQTLVVATIFQLSRDLRDTYSQLFEKGPRRFSFNDFVAFVAIALKERVSLVWLEMISKPMTPAEHQQLRKSIESFLKKLDTLLAKLDQPPTDLA